MKKVKREIKELKNISVREDDNEKPLKRARKTVNYNEDKLIESNIVEMKIPKSISVKVFDKLKAIPSRATNGELIFEDHPEFKPNLTPKEVLQMGSFGGTYFRPIKSRVTGLSYRDEWEEFPVDWFCNLNIKTHIASSSYNKALNTYKADCGGDLDMWESSGIHRFIK
jgi:hypothetical protein